MKYVLGDSAVGRVRYHLSSRRRLTLDMHMDFKWRTADGVTNGLAFHRFEGRLAVASIWLRPSPGGRYGWEWDVTLGASDDPIERGRSLTRSHGIERAIVLSQKSAAAAMLRALLR